jgi:hypothetical protein
MALIAAKMAKMAMDLVFGRLLMYISRMRRKKLHRNIPELPWSLKQIRGAIGKEYVIKHYSYGAIKTKYPDMTNIIASTHQRKQRNLFKESVEYTRSVMSDPIQKELWLKRVRKKHRLFNYLVAKGMAFAKTDPAKRQLAGERIIGTCFETRDTVPGSQKPENNIGKQLPAVNFFASPSTGSLNAVGVLPTANCQLPTAPTGCFQRNKKII